MTGGASPFATGTAAGPSELPRPEGNGFGIENLPFGVARLPDGSVACVSALDASVIDLARLARAGLLSAPGLPDGVFEDGSLNRFLACGRDVSEGVRRAVARMVHEGERELGRAFVPVAQVELLAPVAVGDFVDFSASIHHATRVGRLLRPDGEPLPPQWRHMPVGYHGRAGSVVASGTAVTRPHGQRPSGAGEPVLAPTAALDFEAEVGFVVGAGSAPGARVATAAFADHVAGVVLVNDWSARDVQAYESRPLGPFLGKSFATSVSPWLVTLEALEPYRVPGPVQDPEAPAYLRTDGPAAYDLHVEVAIESGAMRDAGIAPVRVSAAAFAAMYWTGPQLLAHATVNGARVRPGDLVASGTVSGPDAGSEACLLELTHAGERPLSLPDGSTRAYLEDGDTVVVRGWAGGEGRPLVSLGEVTGTVLPAQPMEV
ncbi:MAG: fumarylacetoacetase [Acidimicrobiales bacterium]